MCELSRKQWVCLRTRIDLRPKHRRWLSRWAVSISFRHQIKTSKGLRIMVNGRENEVLEGLETELKDGDTVTFFPLVFGG